MRDKVQRSIDVVLIVDGIKVAGQQNATLSRSMVPIDITNQINGEWRQSIAGVKSWDVSCGGSYVKDEDSLGLLEDAFVNNKEIEVKIVIGKKAYAGQALITDFPLNAVFNTQFKYAIKLLGTGELKPVENQ